MMEGMNSWQHNLNWLEDDDDQDSDTDSKLSGSAAADSVLRHLSRSRKQGNEFSLGTMREQDEEDAESAEGGGSFSSDLRGVEQTSHGSPALSNGYHQFQQRYQQEGRGLGGGMAGGSPKDYRVQDVTNSPKFLHQRNYENTQMGGGGGGGGGSYLYASRKKELLSPVPETTSGGARVLEVSMAPRSSSPSQLPQGQARKWSSASAGPSTRSMENVTRGTPPSRRRGGYESHHLNGRPPHYREVRIPQSNGLAGDAFPLSRSQEFLSQGSQGHFTDGLGAGMVYPGEILSDEVRSDVNVGAALLPPHYRRPSSGSTKGAPGGGAASLPPGSNIHGHSQSFSGYLPTQKVHYRAISVGSGGGGGGGAGPAPIPNQQHSPSHSHSTALSGGVVGGLTKTPPQRRTNYTHHDIIRDASQLGLSQDGRLSRSNSNAGVRGEPNLQDVVQFLRSEDKTLVSNAASYLQHLAYGDDAMKTKIREHGAIPVLTSLIRHQDSKVLTTVLGALKNLSYGRSTKENKHAIASDHALMDIMMTLKNSRSAETRGLLTALLWNLSSCEDLKLKLMKACLHDLVEMVMVPCTGWSTEAARMPTAQPQGIQWNAELKNATGILRNISSAGESSRSFLRNTNGMVDTLVWLLKAGVQQGLPTADEKTAENTVCVLRNLSYRLETEVDPQEGGEDGLDREWEQEQRRELEDLNRSFSKASPAGCLPFCVRPQTRRDPTPRVTLTAAVRRTSTHMDFAFPDPSVLPKRRKPVYGQCLLWQPEVAFVYMAVMEKFPDCVDAVEAATGAIQNLTACNWKWSVYICNIIRTANGLHVLAELLNNGHDTVVRAAATTVRNLAKDQRNRAILGAQAVTNITPRLPLSTNHLGISEETSTALLCCLMELFRESPENAKLFRDQEGVLLLTRLTRSREYTPKVTYAAHKVCSLLWEYKDCRPTLKKAGWDLNQYSRITKDFDSRFEFETTGSSMSRDFQGSRRKKMRGERHGASTGGSRKSGKRKKEEEEDWRRPSNESILASQNFSNPSLLSSSGPASQTSPTSTLGGGSSQQPPVTFSQSAPSGHQFLEEPNYQTIPTPKDHAPGGSGGGAPSQQKPASPALIEPCYQSVPTSPGQANSNASRHTPPNVNHAPNPGPGPTILYQSIEDTELSRKPSTPGGSTDATSPQQGGPLSSGGSGHVETTPSITTSGPLSITSLEEETEHDPNATYASVDIEKKRASRRIREQKKKEQLHHHHHHQQQQQPRQELVESIDSWV